MQTTFFICLGRNADSTVSWFGRNAQGVPVSGKGEMQEAALRGQGSRIVVVVPADAVLPLKANLPPLQGHKLRSAVPYAVEEHLAEEVEAYHFALGKRLDNGTLPLLAVSRAQMLQWQELLAEADVKPHAIYSEAQLLPWSPGELTLLLDGDGTLLRLSPDEGYRLPVAELEMLIELAREQLTDTAATLRIFDARGSEAAEPQWHGATAQMARHYKVIDDAVVLLASSPIEHAINLLQGEFSRKERFSRLWRPWRASAALLAAWMMLWGGVSLFDYYRLAAEEDRLYEASEQLYRDTFPEAKNVVNPKIQMQQKLDALQGGGSGGAFVTLLASTAPLMKAAKGAELQNLRYRQGELEVELLLADLPALDALKESLEEQGLSVAIRNASSREGRVEGRLAIRGAGA